MPKLANELSALEVKRLQHPGGDGNIVHAVGGVSGLMLQLLPGGGKTWLLRTTVGVKRRHVGLGGYPEVTLAMARERAREAKELVRQGVDPVEHRKAARSALIAAQRRGLLFGDAMNRYEAAKLDGMAEKGRKQWRSMLDSYAVPAIGAMIVQDIAVQDVLRALEPIWSGKTETARKMRAAIEAILSWSTVAGHRTGDNPARWKGNLDALLPKASKVAKSENQPAVALADASTWFAALRQRDGMGSRALEFVALTAARSGEVRGATWDEIDLKVKMWTIPAARMKGDREHRVPLTAEAVALLQDVPRMADSDFVFPAVRGGQLSDMTLSATMRRMNEAETSKGRKGWLDPRNGRPAVPHGLRSTFRDWAAETGQPRDMAEIALAHSVGSDVERAYRRSDMLDRRRAMMATWAKFLGVGNAERSAVCAE